MTCREKLKLEHPEEVDVIYNGGCRGCPSSYGYLDDADLDMCLSGRCTECWNREIPGTKPLTYEHASEAIGKVTETAEYANGVEFKVERTNSTTDHPCRNCNTGWESISRGGYAGCEDTCERLKEYTNRNIEKEKNMAAKKTKAELEKELEDIKESKAELEKELKNLEKYKQYEDMAGEVHAIYMSFVHAGFSEERAYDLLKTMIMVQNGGNVNFNCNATVKPSYKNYR